MPKTPLRPSVQRALVRHALLTGLIAVALSAVALGGVWMLAEDEGHRTARRVSMQVASALTVPLSERDFRRPDPDQRAELLHDLAPFLDSDMIHRVKVWLVEGDQVRIVFSDEPRIEGEVRDFDQELARRLDAGDAVAMSLPHDNEHRYELADGEQLVEVFIGFSDSAGNPMRLEVYVPVDVAAATRHAMAVILPVILAGLLALGVATIPLTVSLARRMERDQQERQAALRYGLAASDMERRELAQQLHDGVIQDLAGTGLLLDAIRLADEQPAVAGHRRMLDEAHRLVEDDVRRLRSLATDLLPSAFVGDDLHAALAVLVDQLRDGDATVDIEVEPHDRPDSATLTLLHRVARELLRNAFRHSRAGRITVRVAPDEHDVALTVADDGVGFDPGQPPRADHFGLQLVRRAVEESGGRLTVVSAPGTGTTITAALPYP